MPGAAASISWLSAENVYSWNTNHSQYQWDKVDSFVFHNFIPPTDTSAWCCVPLPLTEASISTLSFIFAKPNLVIPNTSPYTKQHPRLHFTAKADIVYNIQNHFKMFNAHDNQVWSRRLNNSFMRHYTLYSTETAAVDIQFMWLIFLACLLTMHKKNYPTLNHCSFSSHSSVVVALSLSLSPSLLYIASISPCTLKVMRSASSMTWRISILMPWFTMVYTISSIMVCLHR